MWFFRRSARVLLSIGLAILFAVLSILRVPQIAWSQLSHPAIPSVQSTLVAANNAQEVAQEFRQRFVCVMTSEELSIASLRDMSEAQIRAKMVRRLADQLKPCIQQNRIGNVDVSKLIGVIYTTQLLEGDRAVIVVGVGIKNDGVITFEPIPDPLGTGTTNNGTPANGLKIIIVNAKEIDGKPRQVGESFPVQISAVNRKGNDISSNATLENAERTIVGRGANITYTAGNTSKNECLTARVAADGQESWYTACFTISPKDIEVGENVKVFDSPDQQDNLLVFDTESGITCFRDDASLQKKLKVGDKVIPFFNSIPTQPTVLSNELLLPPVKLISRIPISGLDVGSDFPKNAACFQSSVILNWTEIITKGEVSHEFSEVSFDESPGFTRISDDDDSPIGFAEIKEGWVEGVAEDLKDLFRPGEQAASDDYQAKGLVQSAQELAQYPSQSTQSPQQSGSQSPILTGRDFGTGSYSDIIPKNYTVRVSAPLIDAPSQDEQTPGKKGTSQKPKCTKLSSQQQNYQFKATGFVGLKVDPNANGKLQSGLKNAKLDIKILKSQNLATFTFDAKPTVDLIGGVTMNGRYNLACEEEWLLYEMPTPVVIPIGPTPFWIHVFFSLPLTLNANLDTSIENGFFAVKVSGQSHVNMKFDLLTGRILNPNDLKKVPSETKVSIAPLANGQVDARGNVKLTLEPTFKFLVESLVGPAVGFAGNAQATVVGRANSRNNFLRLAFTHWYEINVKLAENGILSKFDNYFSGIQSVGKAAKQICTLDKVDFKDRFKSTFSLKEPQKDLYGSKALEDRSFEIALRLSVPKGINNVVNTVSQPVKAAVTTVGKPLQQAKKQLEALPRKVEEKAGKIIPKEVKSAAQKAKGWCTQVAKVDGINLKQWVLQNAQIPVFRYPDTKRRSNVVCEDGSPVENCSKSRYAILLGERTFQKPES
jgi:hypothetical protein